MYSLAECHGIKPVPLAEVRGAWDNIIANRDYVPYGYLQTYVNYNSAYMAEKFAPFEALNTVLFDGEEPIGVWPLNLWNNNGTLAVGSDLEGVVQPLPCQSASRRQKKAINSFALQQVEALCRKAGLKSWIGKEVLVNGKTSPWHKAIMEKGATLTPWHNLYVDLGLSVAEIRAQFRKSYRPLITKAENLWQVQIIDSLDKGAIKAFRALHIEVSGRVTRSEYTWDLQGESVAKGEAFLVFLRDDNGKLVGASFFIHSGEEGFYGAGVYDRSLFDRPLGHLVQMIAIKHMKALGLKWYCLGNRPYPGDTPAPNEKDINIGFFKEGFSSHTRLVLKTDCPVNVSV